MYCSIGVYDLAITCKNTYLIGGATPETDRPSEIPMEMEVHYVIPTICLSS